MEIEAGSWPSPCWETRSAEDEIQEEEGSTDTSASACARLPVTCSRSKPISVYSQAMVDRLVWQAYNDARLENGGWQVEEPQ